MSRLAVLPCLTLLASLALVQPSMADPPGLRTLDIGAEAPDFRLPGVDGKEHSLKDYAGAKVLVVVFTCNHCPTAQAYEARLAAFHEAYKDRGVALVAISPNDPKAVCLDELGYTDLGDSLEDMKIRAKDHKFPYPYLYDGDTQAAARVYGVLATPHVYVFDEARKLRYVGRFDDSEVKEVKSHDVRNAVEALLAGRPVPVEKTRVIGCSTKWADKQADARKSLLKWDAEEVSLESIDLDALRKLAKGDDKKLTVINVWATWCGPCVAELPDLVTMHRMYRGRPFRLVTISLDDEAKRDEALKVLRENHVSATNVIVKSSDKDAVAEALDKDWPGPVPYTLILAPGGKVLYRKVGAIDPLEVKRSIVGYLGRTY
ncbi:thiol-disulfide oxidoreductase [Aquisphaera giovannonii]|uniref:Thiol-disulfide oxidoreductase n=1 Tax=Aquisphaera giovannonii TaxID=406548 RepID=A0A5B9W0Q5_9BACT|nr:redoxin domain-containing protein [Aquisphaera giovannonii]QEH33849.1 thiol-disulfide oxidoreductase [Aquisphaera giovannonii]